MASRAAEPHAVSAGGDPMIASGAAARGGDASGRPRIGVVCSLERVSYEGWEQDVVLVPMTYVSRIESAGGRAVPLLPPNRSVNDAARDVSELDGLVLPGGVDDFDPARFGQRQHPETSIMDPRREEYELALVRAADTADLPVLGICRGLQVIAIGLGGGSLIQHLPDELGHDLHRGDPGQTVAHDVRLAHGSRLTRLLGARELTVRSVHHSGLKHPGTGIDVVGWSVDDSLPEAIERQDRTCIVGVQWHPEEDTDDVLLDRFVRLCADRLPI